MFDPTRGPARERVDADELRALQASGTLLVDGRRRRPLYFDGRFLAARDLVRDQNYFLTRQADLGQASGAGVVQGLMVRAGESRQQLTIESGHGLTGHGELVVLDAPVQVDLADIPTSQRLNASTGLLRIPGEPARTRSGIYILALRPLEYSANPIASYPTRIDGERGVNDGDIIEATAVSLIPFPGTASPEERAGVRGRLAYRLFVDGAQALPDRVLPLALVALSRGQIDWLDVWLGRRELGETASDWLGLGTPPRAAREAFLHQHDAQLQAILAAREGAGAGPGFAASEYFQALPPAGWLPAAAIDPGNFSQRYFPPELAVDLSIVAADELPALVAESLLLPPIDLTLSADALEATAVQILVPVARARLRALQASLQDLGRELRPAAPNRVAARRPLEALQSLTLGRLPVPASDTAADAAWRQLLQEENLYWYVRRRNLHYSAEVVAAPVLVFSDDADLDSRVEDRIGELQLTTRYNSLVGRASSNARAELVNLLASPAFVEGSPTLTRAAVRELETVETLDRAAVARLAARFAGGGLGSGLSRLERLNPTLVDNATANRNLAGSGAIPELDRLAGMVDEAELGEFARTLEDAARSSDSDASGTVARLVNDKLREVASRPGTRGRLPGRVTPR